MDVINALVEIRSRLLDVGWTKGIFSRWDGDEVTCYCLSGAASCGPQNSGVYAWATAHVRLCEEVVKLGCKISLTQWNDLSSTSLHDVIALINRAIMITYERELQCNLVRC